MVRRISAGMAVPTRVAATWGDGSWGQRPAGGASMLHQAAACPSSRILNVMPALRSRSTSSMPMAAGSTSGRWNKAQLCFAATWNRTHARGRQLCSGKRKPGHSGCCLNAPAHAQHKSKPRTARHPGKPMQAQLPAHSPRAGGRTPPFRTPGPASRSFCSPLQRQTQRRLQQHARCAPVTAVSVRVANLSLQRVTECKVVAQPIVQTSLWRRLAWQQVVVGIPQ